MSNLSYLQADITAHAFAVLLTHSTNLSHFNPVLYKAAAWELTSYRCAAGKESSMSSLKARMVALKKGMGIGTADVKGTKLPHAAAATDAGAIQQHLALVIYVRCFRLLAMRLLPWARWHLCSTLCSHTLFSQCCTELLTLLKLPSALSLITA